MNKIDLTPWLAIIPFLAPILTMYIKKLIPKLPSALVPLIPVLLGSLADFIMTRSGMNGSNGAAGAILGASAVFVRELQRETKEAIVSKKEGDGIPRTGGSVQTIPETKIV